VIKADKIVRNKDKKTFKYFKLRHFFLTLSILGTVFVLAFPAKAQLGPRSDGYILMRTTDLSPVHRTKNKYSPVTAKIRRGAIIGVRPHPADVDCPKGWMQREKGGYICGAHLKRTKELYARPAPEDTPGFSKEFEAYLVTRRGSKLFRRFGDIKKARPYKVLRKGSILKVRRPFRKEGKKYFETREGMYVEAALLEKLNPPLEGIGVEVGQDIPAGVVISKGAIVYDAPGGKELSTIPRWSTVKEVSIKDGWLNIGNGRYIEKSKIARVKKAPVPVNIGKTEHWLAVDLSQQLLHAYEGERLVRLIPCSTGVRGNTRPGRYRIQLKRRLQTMQLRLGQVRVEDVPWVMYYDREDGIAIHSAYWHDDFGVPKSHGCVNLTPEDAAWVFKWSGPKMVDSDSERFPSEDQPGSRVIVFGGSPNKRKADEKRGFFTSKAQ